ncbi:hypothetical protein PILCRDRAFT_16976 [Piloderma croceum F 1598]|uniref:Tyr recombinase domain-containing protein n=1 Tax=Piloderma croceum (strain F 1598) TaxID=765440 RepID=A0A0C3EUQ0_PILCF|nr:hypothetical protein PILCRDRAFT_16976 [Piloderma croceum F 1598]
MTVTSYNRDEAVDETQASPVAEEELKLHLEDTDSLMEHLDMLINECLADFPDDDNSEIAEYAAKIARANITEQTRTGHLRIIKAYITFHMKRNLKWDAKEVSSQTPHDIRVFITQKCGAKEDGFEGRKFSTAVSTRAALTFWYRNVRPNESAAEWRQESTGICHGLPTRSRVVSEFMIGLKKTKAKAGEVSQSARALSLEDMHRLYDHCMDPSQSDARDNSQVAYLMAFLMLLRVEEAVNLEFEGIDAIPGEREYFDVKLKTRKSAQTGVLHTWRLFANDQDPKICPKRMLILISRLYPKDIKLQGPLFLKVSKHGAILPEQMVSDVVARSRSINVDTVRVLGTSPGLCMARTPSVEEVVSTEFGAKTGPSPWLLRGEVGLKLRH